MDPDAQRIHGYKRWNRKFVNAFWVALITYTVGTSINGAFLIQKDTEHSFWLYTVLVPTLFLAAIQIISEIWNTRSWRWFPYWLVVKGNLFAYIMAVSLSHIGMGVGILLLPIMISVFFFDRKLVVFAGGIGLIAFLAEFGTSPGLRATLTPENFLTVALILLAGSWILFSLVNRGIEIVRNLQETTESRTQLLIENIVMQKVSKTDALTGVYNRKAFQEHVERVVPPCEANGIQLYLGVFDIDDFKDVNDTFGHHFGDLVLQGVVKQIENRLTPDDFVARYGGEEFVVMFTVKPLNEVVDILEQIRQDVQARRYDELAGRHVTVSIGLHEHIPGESSNELFRKADAAMYQAKASGKNRIVVG